MVTSEALNALFGFVEAAALRLPSDDEDMFRAQWPLLAKAIRDEAVYRLFSRPGLLLYVGIAKDFVKRLGEHRKDKDWWHKVARIEIHTYPTRADARTAELQMIIDEQPRYNKSVDV